MAKLDDEKPELFAAQILYREWGRRFTVLQKYLKGIYYYQKSTEFGDEHFLWTLLGLSDALKKSGQFKEAAEAAEKCMEIDTTHLGANGTRMEALFDIAEFCRSLVYAHQGARRRRHFLPAVLLANETVEDCVGRNVPANMLRRLQPWIAELGAHREILLERLNEEEDEFAGLGEEVTRFKVNDPAAKLHAQQRRLDRLQAAMYLGSSAHDKRFLDDLLRHPALESANRSGSRALVAAATECLARLGSLQQSLRTRRPMYAVGARREAALTLGRRIAVWRELELRRCLIKNEAKYILRRLHEARLCRNYPVFFKIVELTKERFESYSQRLFPDRQLFLDALYRMAARAYIDPRNLCRFGPDEEGKRAVYLRRLLGLKGPRLPRDSDLGWPPCLDHRLAFERRRECLALATQPLEILWLFHELCKLFIEVHRYDMARFYAKKTRELSLETGYEEYAVNASHVLMRIELAQHNRNDAKEAAHAALESAQKLKLDFLADFYGRALAFIERIDFSRQSDDGNIAARQRLISGLMPEDLRPGMDRLVRAMESVPAKRRLSVMPGCKPKDKGAAVSTKLTAMPGPPPDFERLARDALLRRFAPSKRIPGWLDFEQYD